MKWTNKRLSSSFSYLVARPMLSGLGGGISRHTEGISMSRPPGPVTSHLLRCELSFRMPSFPFKIPFWRAYKQRRHWMTPVLFHLLLCPCVLKWVCLCVRGSTWPTWSCLKSHKAWTMTGLLVFSSGLRGFSLTMVLDLLTRLWTCLLFSMSRSFSFCECAKIHVCNFTSACNHCLIIKTQHWPQVFHLVPNQRHNFSLC